MTKLKGDVGLFRGALLLAGFFEQSERMIFNDAKKAGGRRLKLWFASSIYLASPEKQLALWNWLHEAFGDRLVKVEFINQKPWTGEGLAVHLKD